MILTYALNPQSLKNWRGMSDSGGRRIKRIRFIDIASLNSYRSELIERLERIEFLRDYIVGNEAELREHDATWIVQDASSVNRRRVSNLGMFRLHLVNSLLDRSQVNQDLTAIVRRPQPTEHGVRLAMPSFSSA